MGRLLTRLKIKTKTQARRLRDDLADIGCKKVTMQKTSDKRSPWHIYGKCRKKKVAMTFKAPRRKRR